jgi:hypothetical protein
MTLTQLISRYPTPPHFVDENLVAFAYGNGYAVWGWVGSFYNYIGDILQ